MNLVEFLVLLVVAGVCGFLGQALAGVSRGGFLVAVVLGLVGAYLGLWLARALDLPAIFTVEIGGEAFPIVWSVVGSALFVAVVSFLTSGSKRKK